MIRLLERLLRNEHVTPGLSDMIQPDPDHVARIDVLQTRVDSLEARVESLETEEERRTHEIRPR